MRALRSTLALFLLLSLAAQAQPADARLRVVLTDGTVLVGTVQDADADPVVVVTDAGIEQRVPAAQVRAIEPLVRGRFTRTDPNGSRQFFVPTARTLGRGTARLGTSLYILPGVAYGVTDWLDLSAATLVGAGDGFAGFVNLNAKAALLRTPGGGLAIGASALAPFGSGVDDAVFGGTLYAVGTFGDVTRSATAGVVGFYGVNLDTGDAFTSFGEGVLLALGGELQVNNWLKVMAEGYVPIAEGAEGGALLPGVRFFGDRFSVDLYGVVAIGDGGGAFAPLANFSYTF